MTIKNIILPIASAVAAIGTASAKFTNPEFIHVKYSGSLSFVCTEIPPTDCTSTTGPSDCAALIVENGTFKVTPAYDNIVNATTCTVRLRAPELTIVPAPKGKIIIDSDDL